MGILAASISSVFSATSYIRCPNSEQPLRPGLNFLLDNSRAHNRTNILTQQHARRAACRRDWTAEGQVPGQIGTVHQFLRKPVPGPCLGHRERPQVVVKAPNFAHRKRTCCSPSLTTCLQSRKVIPGLKRSATKSAFAQAPSATTKIGLPSRPSHGLAQRSNSPPSLSLVRKAGRCFGSMAGKSFFRTYSWARRLSEYSCSIVVSRWYQRNYSNLA
jgi:hypothetical protein